MIVQQQKKSEARSINTRNKANIVISMYYLSLSGLECKVKSKHMFDAKFMSQMSHMLTQKL